MAKSTKRKLFSFLNLLILFVLFCCLSGCGNSGNATPTINERQIAAFSGSPSSLAAGHNSILTVKITDSTGTAVSGATVNFSFVTNNSGGTVIALNGGTTDAGGQAIGVYTAGTTTTTMPLEDTIQATCGSATGVLILTRTASGGGSSSGYQITLSADVTSLTAGKSSIITAMVTDASGNPTLGQAVTFTKLIDHSTMSLITLGTGTTDAKGKAVAVYTAGITDATNEVQDTIEASVSAGASFGAVIISRAGTAIATTGTAGYKMTVTADATSLAAGQSSVITAKVTDSLGNPAQGLTVSFTPLIDNSTMGLITLNSGKTDANGQAVAVYTAGSSSTGSVQDTIQATVSNGGYSSTGAVVITRTGTSSATTPGYKMTLTANITSLAAGEHSILTATVTDGAGNTAGGLPVIFAFVNNNSAAPVLSVVSGTTDGVGRISTIYTAGSGSSGTSVQDTISATVTSGGYTSADAVIITRTGTSSTAITPGYKMTLTANITSLATGEHSILTATVTDGAGNTAGGLPVTFVFVNNNSAAPALSVVSGTTDVAGRISTIYTAGSGSSGTSVQDTISATVTSGGYTSTAAAIITRTAGSTVATGYVITVTPTPASLVSGAMSVLIAQVYKPDGTAASSQSVNFELVTNNSGATLMNLSGATVTLPLTPLSAGTTDSSGQAIVVYTAGSLLSSLSIQDAVQATLSGGESGAAIITRLPAVGTGNRIISFTQNPVTDINHPIVPPYKDVKMMATVTTDDGITPVKGKEVTFSIIAGSGTLSTDTTTFTTDDNGQAFVIFTRPTVGYGDTVVRAQIEGTTNGGDAASIVYWRGMMPTLKLTASSTSVRSLGTSNITATVTDGFGNAIVGLPVDFKLELDNSGATLKTISGTTDAAGIAVAVYSAGSVSPGSSVGDSISATTSYDGYESADAISITVTEPAP